MKSYFVIGSTDGQDHHMYYWTHDDGRINLSDILHAHRFETMDEAYEVAKRDFQFGFTLVHVADVTLEKMQKEYDEGDRTLYNKFHDPLYTTM